MSGTAMTGAMTGATSSAMTSAMNGAIAPPPRYRDVHVGGCTHATAQPQPDGGWVLRSTEALGAYPQRMSERLAHWAEVAHDRVLPHGARPAATGSA